MHTSFPAYKAKRNVYDTAEWVMVYGKPAAHDATNETSPKTEWNPVDEASHNGDVAKVKRWHNVALLSFLAACLSAATVWTMSRSSPAVQVDIPMRHDVAQAAGYFHEVFQSINTKTAANPCDNFYEYVCGNWESNHPGQDSNFNVAWQRIPKRTWQWMHRASGAGNPSKSARKVALALGKCARVFTGKKEAQAVLEQFLKSHGIPLHPRKGAKLENPLDVLVRLSVMASLPVTLQVEPSANLRNEGRMILLFSTGRIVLRWINDIHGDLFSAANFIGGAHFANDVIIAQSRISTWTENYTVPADPEYITVRELAARTPGIPAHRWLKAINQNKYLKLDVDDEVYLFNPRGVELTHKIVLGFEGQRTQILRWIAMTIYSYLSPAMSFTLMSKLNKTPLSCYDYMIVLAPYALAIEATRHEISFKELDVARGMYQRLRTVVKSSFDWMNSESQEEAIKRVDAISPIFGVPKHLNAPSRMDQAYSYLDSFKGVFIRHLLNSLEGKAMAALKMYNGSFSRPVQHLRTMMHMGSLRPDTSLYFFPFYHVIVVPPRFLVPPFVLVNSTAASYGGLGHSLATEVFRVFDPARISLSTLGVRFHWIDERSLEALNSKWDCLLKRYATQGGSFGKEYSQKTLEENYADVAGYQAAIKALRIDPSFKPKESSPVQGLSNEQLFYVSLCYKWCTTDLALKSNDTSHTRPDHRCNVALSTEKGFKDAFGCPERPDMICDVL